VHRYFRYPLFTSVSVLIDLGLIALFGLQHSLMARPWFKAHVMRMPAAFERCTYVHMANLALFLLIFFWHPIPVEVWQLRERMAQEALWIAFACGWLILLAGAWSFGIGDLLGLAQMREWVYRRPPPMLPLRTGGFYRWLRHPMYVGVLLGVWATPHMSVGHMLLALGLTIYVLIAVRYEERDLAEAFGALYRRWREAAS
jgi:protein-S-isoprenylcysteine O-methyltransferase Ste14